MKIILAFLANIADFKLGEIDLNGNSIESRNAFVPGPPTYLEILAEQFQIELKKIISTSSSTQLSELV